jgi:hypothetical protein
MYSDFKTCSSVLKFATFYLQKTRPPSKAYRRSPYREATTVVRVPESLLPSVYQLLDQARQDVEDELIFDNVKTVKFFAPDVAYADARKYLPALLKKRGVDSSAAMLVLDRLEGVVQSIDA